MNKIQLSPYINFQGRAREAMEFYQKVFGGNLDLQTSDERGAPKPAGRVCAPSRRPGARSARRRAVDGAGGR